MWHFQLEYIQDFIVYLQKLIMVASNPRLLGSSALQFLKENTRKTEVRTEAGFPDNKPVGTEHRL